MAERPHEQPPGEPGPDDLAVKLPASGEQASAGRPDPGRRRGRQLGLLVVLALAGVGLAAVAASLTWWSADYLDPLTGPLTVALSGGQVVPEIVPLALVGLAGLGAALATHGTARRLVGLVLLACGAAIAVRSTLSLAHPPTALVTSLARPAGAVGSAQLHPLGPSLGLLGGLLLGSAGLAISLGVGGRARMGSKYDAPTTVGGTAASSDPADWWKALDAGADPTAADSTAADSTGTVSTGADPTGGDATDPRPVSTGRSPAAAGDRAPDGTVDPEVGTASSPAHTPPGAPLPGSSAAAVSEQTSGGGYHDPNAASPP